MKQYLFTALLLARVNVAHAAGVSSIENAFNNFGDILFSYVFPIFCLCLTAYSLIQMIGSNGTTGYKLFCGALILSCIVAYLTDVFGYFFGWSFDF